MMTTAMVCGAKKPGNPAKSCQERAGHEGEHRAPTGGCWHNVGTREFTSGQLLAATEILRIAEAMADTTCSIAADNLLCQMQCAVEAWRMVR